jgi:hypothetical protein
MRSFFKDLAKEGDDISDFFQKVHNLGRGASFWVLSLFCEMPFFFLAGLFVAYLPDTRDFSLQKEFPGLWFSFLVALCSLILRALSLHLIGSWALKWFLAKRGANPLLFGLADLVLANLWIGLWALVEPHGPTSLLFQADAGKGFFLTPIWFTAILPIAFGSAAFRWIFRKPWDSYFGG